MTNQQAINVMRKYTGDDTISPVVQEAHNMAIAALEKQEPKKPVDVMRDRITTGWCPICGSYAYITMNYCSCCGQALDWKEGD